MYRRLFFLFPDKVTTQKAVQDLIQENISIKQVHSLSKPGVNLEALPSPKRKCHYPGLGSINFER